VYKRQTQSLALKDDKYQPFPIDDSVTELNRSKYWFKQWWQIRFSNTTDNDGIKHYWYEIFSDIPYYTASGSFNFDKIGNLPMNKWYESIAVDPLNKKLLIGRCTPDNGDKTENQTKYPYCSKTDKHLDLTKSYNIVKIDFENFYIKSNNSPRLIFDNYGNIFLNEGEKGDGGDINSLDRNERITLTKVAKIKLYSITNRCIQINITPSGEVFKSKCN
jgi:hypothetical protein